MATMTVVPGALAAGSGEYFGLFTTTPGVAAIDGAVMFIVDGGLFVDQNLHLSASITQRHKASLSFSLSYPGGALKTANPVRLGITTRATLQLSPPNFEIPALGSNRVVLVPTVVISHSTPVIANGRPIVPTYLGTASISGTATLGPNDIHCIPNPNPVWDGFTDGWFYPPPASGVGDARWTVDDLPDPAGFPGQFYWLGDPSPYDGTAGIAPACRQWAANAGTPGQAVWHSAYPYKPSVRSHVNYGPGGNILTVTKGVRFNPQFIEHMWLDTGGSGIGVPFSWVIVGIVMDFPFNGYEHTLLDVGGDPRVYGAGVLNENQLNIDRGLSDLGLGGGSRPAIFIQQNTVRQFGDLVSGELDSPFNWATRPKMWFGVWDGSTSLAGSYSTTGKYLVPGTMPATVVKNVLLGRRGGILSRNWASHLVVFEMRFWRSALVEEQIDDQYNQLSATFDFSSYA